MTVRIREATLNDVPQIARLAGVLGYLMDAGEMSGRLRQVLKRPDELVLAAEADSDGLAGWTHAVIHTLLTSPLTCELQALVVSPRHRRLGAGRALVAAVEAWSLQRGVTSMIVRSNVVRPESHAFYPSLGYARTKTQHVYAKVLAATSEPRLF
jgi:GNAT superfamily N-acetyltransferase